MEMSDFMKYYLSMHRLGHGAEEITKSLIQSLVQNQAEQRKIKRQSEDFVRRNIPIGMSPYRSPVSGKQIGQPVRQTTASTQPENQKVSRRDLLNKWKEEKEKRRQQERAKAKPVFKVCHIATSLQVDLENVNKMIKGKVIASKMVRVVQSHQFVPPKGLKPVPGFGVTGVAGSSSTLKSGSSSTIKGSATRQMKQSSQKMGAVRSPYNLRTGKAAKPSTKSPPPFITVTTPLVTISPFVTVQRGDNNARDEYKVKHATSNDEVKNIDPDLVAEVRRVTTYFLYLLNFEAERISGMCEKWETFVQDNEVPEEATSSIDVAIGQARLLLAKNFNQFKSLIVQFQTKKSEEKLVVTSEDLHGFWDMIYMQIEDLNKRFGNLDRLKDSNWEEMLPEKKTVKTQNKPAASSRLTDTKKAARAKQRQGGFLETQSPLKEQSEQSLLKTLKQTPQRISGLVVMKVGQSVKRGHRLTPVMPILKTGSKSVIFREPLADIQLITPQAKRCLYFLEAGHEN